VKRDHGPLVEGTASFHTTRWTIVIRAAQSQAEGEQSALAELCSLSRFPLYILARRRVSPKGASDLTQWVFLHVLAPRVLAPVHRLRAQFANRLDELSAGEVKTLIHRLGTRYTALLREEVSATLPGSAAIDEEIYALCNALVAFEGRLGP
jgi:hypothetical protein